MEFEGMIVQYLGRQTGTSKAGRPWQKDEYVCETPGTYPRKVKFHIFGDKADQLKFENGKSYVLSCDIESREFNGRWYTARVWRLPHPVTAHPHRHPSMALPHSPQASVRLRPRLRSRLRPTTSRTTCLSKSEVRSHSDK